MLLNMEKQSGNQVMQQSDNAITMWQVKDKISEINLYTGALLLSVLC